MLRLYPKSLFMRFSEHYPKMNIGQAPSPIAMGTAGDYADSRRLRPVIRMNTSSNEGRASATV